MPRFFFHLENSARDDFYRRPRSNTMKQCFRPDLWVVAGFVVLSGEVNTLKFANRFCRRRSGDSDEWTKEVGFRKKKGKFLLISDK